ncbi:SCO family protein [Edaphobacter modestus]|uniref:Protein SCO1/2 n=1 Tax=Edaphobacter modestus TaxID=388466 RepID=A0A4Q7YPV3_9BACT|nr:SCO family protein [Edaphobacter modestus]RZU39490.1 protein SCO1/2 [Edaphobacter modestus]
MNWKHPGLFALLLLLSTLVPGCRKSQSSKSEDTALTSQEKSFPIRGRVIGTDATHVTLAHEAIPGFMEAMTMPYKLKDPSVISELHPGDTITATLHVKQDEGGYHDAALDNIVVVAQARPDYKPAKQYHIPQVGEAVPDFRLTNQSGHTIHLSQFHGRVLVATFIYTRCPFTDYCPLMSRNFAEIDQTLATDRTLYAKTHLLSISFDPAYDTPAVLRSYGGAYTGKYTKESFAHWDFAVSPEKELNAMLEFFDVGLTTGEDKTLTHSLSTVVIGKDGKIAAWYPTNDWKPADVVEAIKKAAAV